MSDRILQFKQIFQYPQSVPQTNDLMLLQRGDGGPYVSAQISDFITVALTSSNTITISGTITSSGLGLPINGVIGWGTDPASQVLYAGSLGGALGFDPSTGWRWDYANPQAAATLMMLTASGQLELPFGTVMVARDPCAPCEVATRNYVDCFSVSSFNGRTGDVCLNSADVYSALGMNGRLATEQWVNASICTFYQNSQLVYSFNGRWGCVTLTADDITAALTVPGVFAQANSPALGDASGRIATTLFVDESLQDLEDSLQGQIDEAINLSGYAPLASPAFSGIPTAPTANPGTHTGQLATTAFVQAAVTASTTGVSSFNTRTGAITLLIGDITGAGGAPLASPALTGTPTAPTAAPATSTTQVATTAFVAAAISAIGAGVTSFNGRSGAVTLTTADVTGAGGAPVAGPAFTGTVTAPTAAPATNNTTVATTAYVTAAIAALGTPVTSFNGRTGAVTLQANDVSAVGGALIASPTFTGVPAAPTAVNGTNTTQLATCAFVLNEITALSAGVTSFNTRTGAVTLVTADITGAGGAPIASPNLTGVPTAPTAAQTDSSTTLATTAFVHAAVAAAAGVTSFNSRTGAVTLSSADVSGAGGALIASPTFTGTPAGPTAAPGTSTTQLATTQFVAAAVAATVVTFNGRNGAVTLTSADITSAGGALLASPALTGTPTAPTPTAGTSNTQIATTAFVQAVIAAGPYLPLTGGTLTGNLTVAAASPTVILNKSASGGDNLIVGQTGGVNRWQIDLGNATAESGTNTGSDFTITEYNNTGTSLGMPFFITRSNSVVNINQNMVAGTTACTVGGNGIAYQNYYGAHSIALGWNSTVIAVYVDNIFVGNLTPASDYRIKKDVFTLPGMWARVKNLRPVSYSHVDFTPPSAKERLVIADDVEHWGFVAHELQDVLIGDAASGVKDMSDGIQSPNVWPVVAALTKALQEAMTRIEALEEIVR